MKDGVSSPAFARLAWSNLAAQSAEQLALAATPMVAVLAFEAGPGGVGMLQTAQTLPFLLFAVPAGLLADRVLKARLMAAAESFRMFALLAVFLLASSHTLTMTALAVLGFLGACATVTYSVAAPALIPALVPKPALTMANGRLELARTSAFTAGPAAAGVVINALGAAPAFALAAALSLWAVWLIHGIEEPTRQTVQAARKRHPVREIQEGAAFVLRHPLLRPVFVTQFIFGVSFFVLQAAYVPYAVNRLGLSAAAVGWTLAAYGGGMVAGALAANWISRRLPFGVVVGIGPICGFFSSLVMLGTLFVPSGWLAALSFFTVGAGPIVWVISTATLRQTVTPPDLLGRVSAINILAYGSRPIGAALGALLGQLFGMEACLISASAGFLAQAATILSSPVVRLREPPQGPA